MKPKLERVLSGEDILRLQKLVRRVPVGGHVVGHVVKLARLTRPKADGVPQFITDYATGWGRTTRIAIYDPRAGVSRHPPRAFLADGRGCARRPHRCSATAS
jgi:hypothetical protein